MFFLVSGILTLLFDSLKGVAAGESLPFSFIASLFKISSTE